MDKPLFDLGEMHIDNAVHDLRIGEFDVMEEAAAQEGVRQFFFVIRRDEDDRAGASLHRFTRLVDIKLHAVEFEQQIIGKFDVSLVDFVDEENGADVAVESLPQLALADVIADIGDARVTQLAVAQAGDSIIFIETLMGLGRRFDVPFDERCLEGACHLAGEHRFAGARLAFHQERALKGNRGIHRNLEVVGGDIIGSSVKTHRAVSLRRGEPREDASCRQGALIAMRELSQAGEASSLAANE